MFISYGSTSISRRVQKFRADYAELKGQFEKVKNEVSRSVDSYVKPTTFIDFAQRTAAQRNELLHGAPSGLQSPSGSDARRRFTSGHFNDNGDSSRHSESPFRMPTPLPNQTLREHHALNEHSFIQSTETRLDEFIAQGREVLDNLVDQRNVLKGTQRRLLDAANTLGLSREVIGWIERRRYASLTWCERLLMLCSARKTCTYFLEGQFSRFSVSFWFGDIWVRLSWTLSTCFVST